ncbi:Flp family type IVb pilin [Rhodoferax sediminis]|jgi:pilus assembly protein Flp/PilA|uniref:Flp family type IVb pilin n=1 Tax=Rhodoferax sediminis TaxID=2509614 RepID=A0A515D9R6_9BURK|nr:Flp family type IVb pilin [Rhodoferax sediminis]QDL37134.1 Flp family type IVb pilin [Rhodoferax sediminis]
MNFIKNFVREEDGVTAVEYGLIASMIAVAIIAGASLVGISLNTLFTNIGNCLSTANCAAAA